MPKFLSIKSGKLKAPSPVCQSGAMNNTLRREVQYALPWYSILHNCNYNRSLIFFIKVDEHFRKGYTQRFKRKEKEKARLIQSWAIRLGERDQHDVKRWAKCNGEYLHVRKFFLQALRSMKWSQPHEVLRQASE